MLRLYSQEDLRRCPLDKWGIMDPGTHRREEGKEMEEREDSKSSPRIIPGQDAHPAVLSEGVPPIDLVLLPGVAFDVKSNRVSVYQARATPDNGAEANRSRLDGEKRFMTISCTYTPHHDRHPS